MQINSFCIANIFVMLPLLQLFHVSTVCDCFAGYCGADLKALCTEAALHALRRRYPQIYTSQDKLQLDVTKINVSARDFHHGMQNIVPASQRAVTSPGRALSNTIKPLLSHFFEQTLHILSKVFPMAMTNLNAMDLPSELIAN